MTSIEIGKVGKILSGEDAGHYVKIERDPGSISAYLILTSDTPDFQTGFDDWVSNSSDLAKYLEEPGWQIEWLP